MILLAILVFASAAVGADPQAVVWQRGETDVVLRYEVTAGRAMRAGTEVPRWTLYGDGLVVWTDEAAEPTPGFAQAVWTGRLDTAAIRELLTAALEAGFFELEADHRPPPPPSSADADPIPLPLDAASEILSVALVDRRHRVRVRPAGWSGAPAAFRDLRDRVLTLEPEDSRRFVPQAYRLRALPLPNADADDFPTLPDSAADLDRAAAVPLALDKTAGESLAAVLVEIGTRVARGNRVFALQLFAVPPRTP